MADQYDLIVIGAGPGGYVAAEEAASKGRKVAVVEYRELGGTCLNRGCIPTKTMVHATELYEETKKGAAFGVMASSVSFDYTAFDTYKREVLENLRAGIAGLFKSKKITLIQGKAKIVEPNRVKVEMKDGICELAAEHILIAVGSSPAKIPVPGSDISSVYTSDDFLDHLMKPFSELVIVGGGVIGMEFASIYSALSCKVTVIEAMDRILAGMDKEISQNLKMILKKRGVEIHTGAAVQEFQETENGVKTIFTLKGETMSISSDAVLLAVGRKTNLEGLCEETISLKTERGRLLVNEQFQTNVKGIYAIGDVIPGIQLAHLASAEGICAVHAMLSEKSPIDLSVVPGCVYTSPEIATVGISQEEAKEAGILVNVSKYPMSANGKTVLTKQERGFIKVVSHAETGVVLGAQMMCARATDLIGEFAVAVVNKLTLHQMEAVIHPHPTFCEGIWEAVRS